MAVAVACNDALGIASPRRSRGQPGAQGAAAASGGMHDMNRTGSKHRIGLGLIAITLVLAACQTAATATNGPSSTAGSTPAASSSPATTPAPTSSPDVSSAFSAA